MNSLLVPRRPPHLRILVMILSAVAMPAVSIAAETATITWKVGDEMRQALQLPVSLRRTARPARDGIESLAASQRVACWLDRRIDPNQEVEQFVEATPLHLVLQQFAQKLRAAAGYVGPVVYIGPPEMAAKLWTVAELRTEDIERLPPDLRRKFTHAAPVRWESLSTPRELLTAAAKDAGCNVVGLDEIPHDLWPAANLPPLTLTERLTLILASFDKTFRVDVSGKSIELVPLPDKVAIERTYTPRGEPGRAMAEFSKNYSNATFKRSGTKLVVTGSAEDHDEIRRLLRGEKIQRALARAEIRYQLQVQNQPLGAVVREIERQAKLQVKVDEPAYEKLRERVTFEVTDATLEQLLQAAFKESGLTVQLTGTELHISVSPK